MSPAIPRAWDEVSAAWMTDVLGERFGGARVDDASLVWTSDGTNRRARFALTWSAGEGPDVVFVKAEGEHRELHARNGNLFNEPLIYASGLPLYADHPAPYAVLVDEPALDWLVVMEDVTRRGGDPRDSTRPMTVDQVAAGVRGLARLHRHYRGFTAQTHPALHWVQTWAPTEGFQVGLRARAQLGVDRAGPVLPTQLAAWSGDEHVDVWARLVGQLHRDPTLLHADAHIGNTYVLPGDDVGFLDWQVVRRGNWSQDVGYFLQGALVEDDRRAAERDLVEAYREELGGGLSADDAWLWYRASPAYGLAIWLSTLGTDGYQTHEVSRALVQRYAAAFVELETLDALDALTR